MEVTGNPDDTHATVKTEFGTGTMEMQLLRFAGEETPESWTGYARWNTGFFADYEMGGKAPTTLKTNTKVEVLEELEDCYLVTVDGKTGFVAKAQVSKWPIKSNSGSNDGGSSGGSQQDRQRQKSRQKRRFSAHNSFLPDIQAGTSLPILPFIMRWFFP